MTNLPLNIDLQQILLHWMNLAILTGGLYFLLYKPVKAFIAKREDYYREREKEAAGKLAEAERIHAAYQAKMDAADDEIHQAKLKAQEAAQQSAEEQLNQARTMAQQLLVHARTEAEHDKEQILRSSQRELRKLAAEATKKLAMEKDPFDHFLDLAEEGAKHEEC
ncbi:MAG: ATP synthase F0 subunit B [Oscillospiraceae bacterium]|nr:ATP synthase F0 subunit B [Oscillospiraceae bacterium]